MKMLNSVPLPSSNGIRDQSGHVEDTCMEYGAQYHAILELNSTSELIAAYSTLSSA